MQHFRHLDAAVLDRLFLHPPRRIDTAGEKTAIATALGATLYMPATRPDLGETLVKRSREGVCSLVVDLEDAVADHNLEAAIDNAVATLDTLDAEDVFESLVFVRARTPEHIRRISRALSPGASALAGFVIPKFTAARGGAFLDEIAAASLAHGKRLFAMPVLESSEVVFRETRDDELVAIRELLEQHADSVLAVRIGATDMCGMFGIRRDRDLTIYDVRVVADVISAIVNHLGRSTHADGTRAGYVITGPVWEYFADHERMFRPMLRQTPFAEQEAVRFRQQLVSHDLDALLREVALDRANGIQGKTVIHPSHVAAVHALSAVTHEEFADATDILESDSGGVRASEYGNKMNELGPHRNWAEQTLMRARAFGVTNEGITFVDLLTELAGR